MAYIAVDKNNVENIFDDKPIRNDEYYEDLEHTKFSEFWKPVNEYDDNEVELPKGSIEKLIGRKLTWEDEPVELEEEL